MKFRSVLLIALCSLLAVACKKKGDQENLDSDAQKAEVWESIFNGKDLTGWTIKINGHPLGENIHNTFRVEDGVMKVSYDGYETFGESYGHIFYERPYSSYRLRMYYRFVGEQPPDGQAWAKKNSGVMLHSQSPETMGLNQGFPVSLEAQFLGGVEEGVERPTANLCTPGMHVMMNDSLVTKHCISAAAPTFYGEEWIQAEVLVLKDSLITHSINGKEVIRYTKPVYGGEYLPDSSLWKAQIGKPATEGYIALQSESHPIEFKNIEILNLEN